MIEQRDLEKWQAVFLFAGEDFPDWSAEEIERLESYMTKTDRFIGVFSGLTLLGIYGVARPCILDETGYCWLLDTPEAQNHKIGFLRISRKVVARLLKEFSVIVGICDNRRSVEWVQWIGGEFAPPNRLGFHPFVIRNDNG